MNRSVHPAPEAANVPADGDSTAGSDGQVVETRRPRLRRWRPHCIRLTILCSDPTGWRHRDQPPGGSMSHVRAMHRQVDRECVLAVNPSDMMCG